MDYREALDYLLSFADFERSGRFLDRPDVGPMLSLLRRLGDPHLGRHTIHIAGSKGKGSTAAMVESVLRAAGHATGLFTSPHLHSYTERIRISGEPLPEDEWVRLTAVLREAVEAEAVALRQVQSERKFVTFDLLTALAFLAFREREVEAQVLEVGLGGRLDSTNVFGAPPRPATGKEEEGRRKEVVGRRMAHICAITAIGLEHTDVLGGTVEAIAGEKAGIIRPGSAVVMGPQPYPEAREVIARSAREADCPLMDVASEYSWRPLSHDLDGQTFTLEGPRGALKLRLPLLGRHQVENAVTAIACAEALAERRVEIGDEAIENGLAAVSWPGRLEVLRRQPLVIADAAHSRDSARRLRESLTDYFSCRRAFLIVGMSAGKDVLGLAEELAPVAGEVVAVRADHPRAMAPQEVAAAFAKAGIRAKVHERATKALTEALAAADKDAVICLTGSLFVVAEGRACLKAG